MANSIDDYSVIFPTVGLTELKADAIALSARLEADGERAMAFAVRRNLLELLEKLKSIAARTAADAEAEIKKTELDTRVRPAPTGDDVSLQDFLGRSNPLPEVEGSVGVNDESVLDANVSWWWTQEEGYSGHVGREVTGFFFDSGYSNPSAPDPSKFREHPLFMAGSRQRAEYGALGFEGGAGPRGGSGRRMTIRNPIPERRFVRDGAKGAEAHWHAAIAQARSEYSARLDTIMREAFAQISAKNRPGNRPGGRGTRRRP